MDHNPFHVPMPADTPVPSPTQSALRILQTRCTDKLGVHLDAPGIEDAPVLVTEDVKELRDPSGRYQILGEIGRGGVGTVYKGRDHDLGRDVAMKVLKDEYARRPDVLARFVEEAQIGGQLQHPGIVPVYELGLQAGERPYFAMKLVKGETLAAQLARRDDARADRRLLLGIFEQVCQTIAYAHARRVVHRDLKPANIMIGAFGEVQVVDWGFAKVLPAGGAVEQGPAARASERSVIETVRSEADAGSRSVAGSMLGTPAYMPPEQALGDIERVDRRSDVFALGAILCEVLTGEAPYREVDGDLVRQAASASLEGAHARLRACGADPDLVTLCVECLAPAQRARPESASEVAARIGAYLTSVEERAQQAEVRAAEARYRHRVTFLCSAVGLLVLATWAAIWSLGEYEAQARRSRAVRRVATAVGALAAARDKAQAPQERLDIALWDAAEARAQDLESVLNSERVADAVLGEARALLVEVRAAYRAAEEGEQFRRRDAEMRRRLTDLRIPMEDSVWGGSWMKRECTRLDREYDAAFAAYLGASLFDQALDATLASIGRGALAVELATSLDHWGLVRDTLGDEGGDVDQTRTARLREVAARIDGEHGWRRRLRALLPEAKGERAKLLELAAEADLGALSAAGCRVLGQALGRAGADDAVLEVLRRGREAHPKDFDITFRLGLAYEARSEPRWEDALTAYRMAHALRPDHAEAQHRLGNALQNADRWEEAARWFRRLDAREPENVHWAGHVGVALARVDPERAIEHFRAAQRRFPEAFSLHKNLGDLLERRGEFGLALAEIEAAAAIVAKQPPATWTGQFRRRILELRRDSKAMEVLRLEREARSGVEWFHALSTGVYARNLSDVVRLTERTLSSNPELIPTEPDGLYAAAHAAAALAMSERTPITTEERARLRGLARTWFERGVDHWRGRIEAGGARKVEGLRQLYRMRWDSRFLLRLQGRALERFPAAERRSWSALWREVERIIRENPLDNVEECGALVRMLRAYDLDEDVLACLLRVLELAPEAPGSRIGLGRARRAVGDYRGAVRELKAAAALFGEGGEARTRSHIEELEGKVARLGEIVAERREAETRAEWSEAIRMSLAHEEYPAIVELVVRTLQDAPWLTRGPEFGLYHAARAAVRASARASGSNAQRRLRRLARAWLALDVDRRIRRVGSGFNDGDTARRSLRLFLAEPDFDAFRGEALDVLPEDERSGWRDLWARIEAAVEEEYR